MSRDVFFKQIWVYENEAIMQFNTSNPKGDFEDGIRG